MIFFFVCVCVCLIICEIAAGWRLGIASLCVHLLPIAPGYLRSASEHNKPTLTNIYITNGRKVISGIVLK